MRPATASAAVSSSSQLIATSAPSSASATAMAAPIPCCPPVTSAILPANFMRTPIRLRDTKRSGLGLPVAYPRLQEEPLRGIERRWRHTKHRLGIQARTHLDVSGRVIPHGQHVAEVPLEGSIGIHGSPALHPHKLVDRVRAGIVH